MIKTQSLVFNNTIRYKDMHFKEHQVSFITGESGRGKSTLLKLINRTAEKSSGDLFYRGASVTTYHPLDLRKEILLVNQDPFLFSGTIRENFRLFHSYRESALPDDDTLASYVETCRLNFPLSAKCDAMSGGEKQRLFHAIALSFTPKVLLLDEPTSALDETIAAEFMNALVATANSQQMTLLVVNHSSHLTKRFADDVITL